MIRTRSALHALALGALAACGGGSAGEADLAIMNVAVVDVAAGRILTDRTVQVHDGRIVRIDSALAEYPEARQVIDGAGRYLLPGLWDTHVHAGDDESTYRQLIAWGITSVRDMGSPLDEMQAVRRRRDDQPSSGPRVVYAGFVLRGPQGTADTGAGVVRDSASAVAAIAALDAGGVSLLKVHEGFDRATWFAIALEARERSLPLAGHVPAGLSAVDLAESGLRNIAHFEFLPDRCRAILGPPRRASRPPSGCDSARIDALLRRLQDAGVWLEPTLGAFRVFAPGQWTDIRAGFSRLTPSIRSIGLPIVTGTDLGTSGIVPGVSLHDELELLAESGFTTAEVLRAATMAPARLLGMADSLGQVAPGYLADLVLLEADPLADIRNTRRVVTIIRAGVPLDSAMTTALRQP